VLKGLSDRGELESPLGRVVVTICLVQDFAVVPMLLLLGFVGSGQADWGATAQNVAQVTALGGVLYLVARFVLPPVMRRLMTINTSEVVLLLTILILLGTAWLTAWAGLSLAIGAFAAGLILSETEYYPQIYAEVAPFRTLFSSLFFVSVGMLLDLGFVAAHPLQVVGVALGVLLVKSLVVLGVSLPLGISPRVGLQSGFYVAQIGELSFLLMASAMGHDLMDEAVYQYLIAATSLTLAVTPLIMQFAPRFVWRATGRELTALAAVTEVSATRPQPAVLIVGYGINGHNVARVLREAGIYHEILDTNPETVRRARADGMLIHYGDVTRPEVLKQIDAAGFDSSVLAISDPAATRRAVQLLRAAQPQAHLIVRTRLMAEVEELEKLGANVVVPEEFETSLRIFSNLLQHYRVPPHIIAMQVEAVRGQSYGLLRTQAGSSVIESLERLMLQRLVEAVPILPGSPALGKRLDELGLDADGGCMALSVLRAGLPLRPPYEALVLQTDDLVVLYGNHLALVRAVERMTV
jgi:CPA2 family monovalent cation:H+ antiporter-2